MWQGFCYQEKVSDGRPVGSVRSAAKMAIKNYVDFNYVVSRSANKSVNGVFCTFQ
jgi:hypothetical protein